MSEGASLLGLIVDNNVAVKWYLPQDYGDEALRVFSAGRDQEALLMAPTLIHAEFGNALWGHYQQGELSLAEMHELWNDFEQAPIDLFDIAPLVPDSLEIATACGCTVYDALYVALAKAQETEERWRRIVPLVTADRRLLRRLEGTTYEGLGLDVADIGEFLSV